MLNKSAIDFTPCLSITLAKGLVLSIPSRSFRKSSKTALHVMQVDAIVDNWSAIVNSQSTVNLFVNLTEEVETDNLENSFYNCD